MPVAAKKSTVSATSRKSLAAPVANSTHNFGNGNTKKQSLANQKELSIGLAATIATTAAASKTLPQTGTKPKKAVSATTSAKGAAANLKAKMESKPRKTTPKPRIKSEPKRKPKVEAKKSPALSNRRQTLSAATAAVKQQLGSATELQLKDIDRLVAQLMGTNQLTDALKKQKQELEEFLKRELEKNKRAKGKYAGKAKHKGNSTSTEDDESDSDDYSCDCSDCRNSDECDCSYCRNLNDCSCSYCNASSMDSKFTSAIGSSIDDSNADADSDFTTDDDDSDSFSDEFATSTDDSADEAKIDKDTFSLAALGVKLSKAAVAKATSATSKKSKSKKGKSTTAANKKKKTEHKKSAAAKKRKNFACGNKNSVCPRN